MALPNPNNVDSRKVKKNKFSMAIENVELVGRFFYVIKNTKSSVGLVQTSLNIISISF